MFSNLDNGKSKVLHHHIQDDMRNQFNITVENENSNG